MSRKQTIDHIDVSGRRVLMRVDFNVPLDESGRITDDRRIRLALDSIRSVIQRGGRLILMSHLGRPKGQGREPSLSLEPAAGRLGELLDGVTVRFVADAVSPEAQQAVEAVGDGEVLLLENLRFHEGEKSGDPRFAAALAAYGDVYCHEAFGSAHRQDASVLAVPRAMADRPRVAGLLLDRELRFLQEAIESARRPFLAVLGGAKVSDKLGALANLTGRVDAILVGGAMAYTFLAAQGMAVGASRLEQEMIGQARSILDTASGKRTAILLPEDHVCAERIASDAPRRVVGEAIPDGWMGLDIGPRTGDRFQMRIRDALTVVWNGPMGVFETPPFDAGTRRVAEAIAEATARGAVSIAGGGDTAAAVDAFGLGTRLSHVSTGGGASLQMLEGRRLESVELLDEARLEPAGSDHR